RRSRVLQRGLSAVFLAMVCLCASVGANVSERDWLSPGDGLLTFDDVNNREWLDLSQTILDQFPGSTLEENLQSVLAETMQGGLFEGFSFATPDDTVALAVSAGIDISIGSPLINFGPTSKIVELLSPTVVSDPQDVTALGVVDAFDVPAGQTLATRVTAIFEVDGSAMRGRAGFSLGPVAEAVNTSNSAVMLYREAVPEPTTVALSIAAAVAMICRRPRHLITKTVATDLLH
ncbi:MAG: hypothetical protein AAGD11_01495, partial [Planctomycetota bacterium]